MGTILLTTGAMAEVSYDETTETLRITGVSDYRQSVDVHNIIRENPVSYVEIKWVRHWQTPE